MVSMGPGGERGLTYPPLKRPSVMQATSWPSPAPMIRLVGFSISGMPGRARLIAAYE